MNEKPFPFPGLEPPEPEARLRPRVLRAARKAAAKARTGRFARLVDRLWSSRPLRLTWLAATLALVALNATVDPGASPTRTYHPPSAVRGLVPDELAGGAGTERLTDLRLAVAREGLF